MKILVIGASGQVGHHLMREASRRGHQCIGTYCAHSTVRLRQLDLKKPGAALELAKKIKPDWIFSTAAWAHVDGCEQDPERARVENVDVTREAALAAAETGAGFVYYSSDYVYDGTEHIYTEEATPNPLSVYGRVKLEAEEAALELVPNALILRTAVVYGHDDQEKNTVYQLIRASLEGKKFRVAKDQICSPTYSPNLAAASIELAEKGARGVYHLAGVDILSRSEFALMACTVLHLNDSILEPVLTADFGSPVKRPLLNGLDTQKAASILRMPLYSAIEGLSDFYLHAPVAATAGELSL